MAYYHSSMHATASACTSSGCGMGVVWRAHDRRLGRDVARKILPPHPDALVRLEREARGLTAVSHPHIVSIFDRSGEPFTTRAAILVRLREHERALDALEEAYRRRERDLIYLKTSPTYAALRGHPRFEKLLARIGFPCE